MLFTKHFHALNPFGTVVTDGQDTTHIIHCPFIASTAFFSYHAKGLVNVHMGVTSGQK